MTRLVCTIICFILYTGIYKSKSMRLCVCLFVPYARPQFLTDMDQIWHVPCGWHPYNPGWSRRGFRALLQPTASDSASTECRRCSVFQTGFASTASACGSQDCGSQDLSWSRDLVFKVLILVLECLSLGLGHQSWHHHHSGSDPWAAVIPLFYRKFSC